MKFLAILIVLMLLAVVAFFYLGGVASFDPAEQAQAFRKQVTEGMTWQQVADIKAPGKYYAYTFEGHGPPIKFKREDFDAAMQQKQFQEGFVFLYHFNDDYSWEFNFDSDGKLTAISDAMTMKDLLNANPWQ